MIFISRSTSWNSITLTSFGETEWEQIACGKLRTTRLNAGSNWVVYVGTRAEPITIDHHQIHRSSSYSLLQLLPGYNIFRCSLYCSICLDSNFESFGALRLLVKPHAATPWLVLFTLGRNVIFLYSVMNEKKLQFIHVYICAYYCNCSLNKKYRPGIVDVWNPP